MVKKSLRLKVPRLVGSLVSNQRKVLQEDLKPKLTFIIMEKDLEIDGTVTDKSNDMFEAAPEIQEVVENNMTEKSLAAHHSDLTSEVVF